VPELWNQQDCSGVSAARDFVITVPTISGLRRDLVVGHTRVPAALAVEINYAPPMWLDFLIWLR
jgi:uncharacterized protein (DUF983 family)